MAMMKNNTFRTLILCFLLSVLFLLPCTPYGKHMISLFTDNRTADVIILSDTDSGSKAESDLPPVSLSSFYSRQADDLPGYYDLVFLQSKEDAFSEKMLTQFRQLGIPLILNLEPDGTAILAIFDQAVSMCYQADSMLISMEGKYVPFYYLDGILRIQDNQEYMVFKKRTG